MTSSCCWASTAVSPRCSDFMDSEERRQKFGRNCYISDDTTTCTQPIQDARHAGLSRLPIHSSFDGNTRPHPSSWCDRLHTVLHRDFVESWCQDYQISIRISVSDKAISIRRNTAVRKLASKITNSSRLGVVSHLGSSTLRGLYCTLVVAVLHARVSKENI